MNDTTELTEKKVLVVDDDKILRTIVNKILFKYDVTILEAKNGLEAKAIIEAEGVDLVLTDIKMPLLHGIELLHYIKKEHEIPVILMSAYSDYLDVVEASEIGASDLLIKPFSKNELLDSLITTLQHQSRKQELKLNLVEDNEIGCNYCQISIDDFLCGANLDIPIYIKITDVRFIKVAYKSHDLASNRIKAFREKGLEYLYVEKEDFKKYLDFSVLATREIVSRTSIKNEVKIKFLERTHKTIMQFSFDVELNEEVFEYAKTNVFQAIEIASEDQNSFKMLYRLSSSDVYTRSLRLAVLASMVAMERGWRSPSTLYKIAMGALLSDIGLQQFTENHWNHDSSTMSDDQFKAFSKHPMISVELLKEKFNLPIELNQVILHHHERCDGTGYPKGLHKSQIHPLARIVNVVDEFLTTLDESKESKGKVVISMIFDRMKLFDSRYDKDSFLALRNVLEKGK
jgi:response regulator RpfG family c-di-GMP phosphodiesterase